MSDCYHFVYHRATWGYAGGEDSHTECTSNGEPDLDNCGPECPEFCEVMDAETLGDIRYHASRED